MGRELPGGKRASWWEGSFPVEESFQLPGGKKSFSFPVGRNLSASRWEESFQLLGGKRAFSSSHLSVYRWEESFKFPGGKRALSFPVGRELLGGKGASRWEESLPVGMNFPVRRELPSGKRASLWKGSFSLFQWKRSFLVGKELLSEKRDIQ